MNITFVFDGLQYGGIERVGIEYIKLLTDRGYKIQVINLNPAHNSIENEIPSSVIVSHIKFPQLLVGERHSLLKKRSATKTFAVKILRVLVLCINELYAIFYKKKLLKTDLAIAFSGHFNDLMFVSRNFKNKKKMAWLHGSQYSYYEISKGFFELYKKIGNLVCLSCQDDEKVIGFNKENHIKKVKIYNPINLKSRNVNLGKVAFLKEKYGNFVLMVGRLDKDKDQETLIRAIQQLQKKYKMSNKLVLVGDGPEKERLQKLVAELNLSSAVVFEGLRKDVENYYMAAWVYAHSSPAEGLPTTLLEAMYYNCPIVSTDSKPGTREILQNDGGLISPVGDTETLANNIYKMCTDEKCRWSCVKAGKKRLQEFMPSQIVSQLEAYIKEM